MDGAVDKAVVFFEQRAEPCEVRGVTLDWCIAGGTAITLAVEAGLDSTPRCLRLRLGGEEGVKAGGDDRLIAVARANRSRTEPG